jgi:hypothetical protein
VDERITKPAVRDELSDDEGARYEMLWDWGLAVRTGRTTLVRPCGRRPGPSGRGIGGALIRLGLDRSRRDGVPVILETATPNNVPLYEHLHLVLVEPSGKA